MQADRCAPPSPFHALIDAGDGRHRVLALELGADALRVRLHLIRAARRSIDLQTFIYQEDDSGELILAELIAAARRGVRVRLLADQLLSFDDPDRLAQLALAHRNFELRLYNPTFSEARTQAWEYAAGLLCCFTRLNQRMHNKLFLVDNAVAIIGGRNYRDRYFDLDPDFVYRDRELLATGSTTAAMRTSFEAFWHHRSSVPAHRLHDVGRALLRLDGVESEVPLVMPELRGRLAELSRDADDAALIADRFVAPLRTVDAMAYVADAPAKIWSRRPDANAVSRAYTRMLRDAQYDVVLQTPYLILDRGSRRTFRHKRELRPDLRVQVSTNSLAATDAIPVYALSYKYKKRYLRELGFRIHEFKPHPADLPRLVEGADMADPPRVSMHAKSVIVDGVISLVGTHNFDPRSDRYNTEAALIIRDRDFAAELAATIAVDNAARNSWTIAPRERKAVPFYHLSRLIESLSNALPVFDLWPFRYASSFETVPGCPPLAREHPDFYACHRDVGDFPQVRSFFKRLLTRLATAFGAPLAPLL